MDTWQLAGAITFAALAMIGFGYLGSSGAVTKGYNRYPFWLLATFLLFPTMVLIAFLRDRSPSAQEPAPVTR